METLFGRKDIGPNCRSDWYFKNLCVQHGHDTASHDPDYVLMRTLAVNLRKNGSDLSQYASIIRISSLLEKYGVDYTTGEDLIGKFLSTCYKLQWEPSVAVLTLQKFSQSAERYGHSPMEHANFFNKLKSSEEKLYLSIIRARKNCMS